MNGFRRISGAKRRGGLRPPVLTVKEAPFQSLCAEYNRVSANAHKKPRAAASLLQGAGFALRATLAWITDW